MLLLAGLALLGAAGGCGPRFDETYADDGASGGCPAQAASADSAVNCARYCNIYDCMGCPKTSDECETACLGALGANACLPVILACAVEFVHTATLSCNDDHSSAFLISVPSHCPAC